MIDEKIYEHIRETLFNGSYNLLLGAGVSFDSKDRFDGALPGGDEFRQRLCEIKNVTRPATLAQIYRLLDEGEIQKEVVERFVGIRPGPTVKSITNFYWRDIYTLNVDDALEAAYDPASTSSKQSLQTVNFDNPFFTSTRNASDVRAIHLHGYVGKPDAGFVFAHTEYVRLMQNNNPWMVVLAQLLATEPFIISGTRLDEPDLEYFLSTRTPFSQRATRGPSLLIEPFPDATTEKACEVHGLILVKSGLGEFLQWALARAGVIPNPIDSATKCAVAISADLPPRSLAYFHANFAQIRPDQTPSTDSSLPFRFGSPATWSNIAGHFDIGREDAFDIIEECRNLLQNTFTSEKIVLLVDSAGSGKTTLLRRIGFDLATSGYPVFECKAVDKIDCDATIKCLSSVSCPFILLIDGLADYVDQVVPIIESTQITQRFIVLATERDYREPIVEVVLGDTERTVFELNDLQYREKVQLIDTYRKEGLLGSELATKTPRSFAKQVTEKVFSHFSCRLLNDFRPIDQIVKSLYEASNETDRNRYVAVALSSFCHQVGVHYSILRAIESSTSLDEQFSLKVPLPLGFNSSDDDYVLPLSKTVAERMLYFVAETDKEYLLRIFTILAKAVAPYVSRATIIRKAPEAKLAGRLFDADKVVAPLLGDLGARFYVDVVQDCGWNSRYWEQRALFMAPSDLIVAIQYARQAVALEQHPYTFTTLAKVLLLKVKLNHKDRTRLFDEAYTYLRRAIEHEERNSRISIHPFVTLFRGTDAYLELGGQLSRTQKEQIQQWINFSTHRYQRDRDIQSTVAQLQPRLA